MSDDGGLTSRRILISGSHGLIGSALIHTRQACGETVIPLLRSGDALPAVFWNGDGSLDPVTVSGFDAVVHLAGEPVAGRWTASKKRRIRDSRIGPTAVLARALAAAPQPPRVFLSASGINVYGDTGGIAATEQTPNGSGFLAEVCAGWEDAADPLRSICRVVHLRIGIVLAANGGALSQMLPIFRLGLGGAVAGGHRYLSWVTLHDLVRAIGHILYAEELSGPVNIVSPHAVTGAEFASALAAVIHRPAVLPVPGWLARLLLGGIANETVLASLRVAPAKLLASGFAFQQPTIREALLLIKD